MKITPISTSYMNSIATDIQGIAKTLDKTESYEIAQIAINNLYAISEQVDSLLDAPLVEKKSQTPYKKQFLFLSCPYTANTAEEMQKNLAISQYATIFLMKKGFDVFNPLSHGTNILQYSDTDFYKHYTPYFNWHEMNCRIMAMCDAFIWLDDPKRTPKSNGMLAEVKQAIQLGLPILGLKPNKTNMFDFEIYKKASEKTSPFPITATII